MHEACSMGPSTKGFPPQAGGAAGKRSTHRASGMLSSLTAQNRSKSSGGGGGLTFLLPEKDTVWAWTQGGLNGGQCHFHSGAGT